MLKLYRDAALVLLCVAVLTILVIYMGLAASQLSTPLLPMQNSGLPWVAAMEPPVPNGLSTINVNTESEIVDFDFVLSPQEAIPYIAYYFDFANAVQPRKLVDLTKYDTVYFKMQCEPRNIFLFVLYTLDDKVTDPARHSTYRFSYKFFSCAQSWSTIVVSLDELDTPDWWLERNGYELTNRSYRLDKVWGFGLVNSLQSPLSTPSNAKVTELKLQGEDRRYIYGAIIITALIWAAFLLWFFRRYMHAVVADIKDKVKQDRQFVAYQKLTVEPQSDREKSVVLRYLATEYADPDINLEAVTSTLGINRSKVNEILKEELGLTFSGYINKLRLTEAARLLSEQSEVNVSQIAFAVGYNNVSYFNKLFKEEYGCAPKMFKKFNLGADASQEPPVSG